MYWVALIVADIFIYIFLGMMLMSYDDNYDASKGEYWSWKSMNTFDRYAYIALYLWHVVNIIAVFYVGYKIYRQLTMRTTQASQNTGESASAEQTNSI